MGHHIELQCFFRCEAYNKKQCWVLCCHFIEDIWMSFIFSESFRKRYTHANVPTSLVDGQGSCVLFVGFTLNVPYRYISIFLLCVENSWIYIQCIWFVMFACFLCWLPLLLLSFCSHQWLISRLLAVTFLAHWILDPDLCKVPPKISLRFCLIFWGSEIVSVVSFLIFLFLYQPHLPSAAFKASSSLSFQTHCIQPAFFKNFIFSAPKTCYSSDPWKTIWKNRITIKKANQGTTLIWSWESKGPTPQMPEAPRKQERRPY